MRGKGRPPDAAVIPEPGRVLPILQGLINFCWSIFKWALLIGVIGGIVAIPFLYQQVDEQIRRRVEAKFAQHYAAAGLKVSVRSAELIEGKGIEVRGLAILDPNLQGRQAKLFEIEEIHLSCQTDLKKWLTQEPEVTQVLLRRPTLRATPQSDGSWNVARLLPLPQFSTRSPAVIVESGSVEIFDPSKTPVGTFTLRDVHFTLAPPDPKDAGNAVAARQLRGGLAGEMFRQIQFEGWLDPRGQTFELGGSVDGLELSPELRSALPAVMGEKLQALGDLRAQANVAFRVGYQPARPVPLVFQASGSLARGSLTRGSSDKARLPHPLTDLRANFRITNEGFVVQDLFARSGVADLHLSCRSAGFGPNCPLWLRAEVQQLELDQKLVDVLPEPLRKQWYLYLPAGQINADLTLNYDGQRWKPELFIRCLDVSFAYKKFPYRLEHGRGTLQLKDDALTLNLDAYAGSQPVQVRGEVHNLSSGPYGGVTVEGRELQLDERLFIALDAIPPKPGESERSPKPGQVIRSLKPRGTVNVYAQFGREKPNEPMHRYVSVGLNRCSICYERFPYPIGNITGTVELNDDCWTFRELQGNNDTGIVQCNGSLMPTPQGNQLSLTFTAQGVPLEEELRDAFRPGVQQLWNELRPQGTVDLPEVQVTYVSGENRVNVTFQAEPRENTSIEPKAFPFRLEKLRGTISYEDGRARWQPCQAWHGATRVSSGGYCELLADGGWHLRLENLAVERVRADRDLIQALPAGLKKGLLELNPSGPFSLGGTFDLTRAGYPEAPLTSQWNVRVDFHQASVDFGLKLDNLFGMVTLAGEYNGQNFTCRGELGIDSLTYRDFQFTSVYGPLWIDDNRILLGRWVDQPSAGTETPPPDNSRDQRRAVTAQWFGGTLLGGGWVALGDSPRYEMQAELVDADLGKLAQETAPGVQHLKGKIRATANLRGAGRSLANFGGTGHLALREADIYELPVMISLLKILRIQRPDTNAFSSCDLDFRIEGNHIYLDPIVFSGDAISLEGNGETDFQSNLGLTLRAMLGRAEERLPVLGDLLGGASEQMLLIRVNGTLQDPVVTKEAFPVLNQALQPLQGESQPAKRPQGFLQSVPPWVPRFGQRSVKR